MNKRIGKKKHLSEDDRGATLIELLAAIAIAAVVCGLAAYFYITSLHLYQRISRESHLLNEAQDAFSQIQSLVVNACDGVSLGEDDGETAGSDLYIYNHKEQAFEITHIYRDGAENKLYYCKIPYEKEPDGTMIVGEDKQDPSVLAENVSGFVVDMSNLTSNHSIEIEMDFENRDSSYSSKNTIYMRNQVNGDAADSIAATSADASSMDNLEAMKFIPQQSVCIPKLRVLEVEGCDEYIYGSEGWEDYYQALFPWYSPVTDDPAGWLHDTSLIEVTTMPTWEFICSTGQYSYDNAETLTTESSDDLLTKYDMILFGPKQDASNNDITLKKLLELEDFLRAGKPVVIDAGLYSDGAVDTEKVDTDTKIYDLITWDGDGSGAQKNIFISDEVDSEEMEELMSDNICRIAFYDGGYPTEYSYIPEDKTVTYSGGSATAQGVIANEIYGSRDSSGTAVLTYHFYIMGSSSERYNAYLNLDWNSDGVYSGSLKEKSAVDNMNAALGLTGDEEQSYDTSESALGLTIYDKNMKKLGTTSPDNPQEGYALKANTEYYATRTITSAQQGILPWKLEVQARSNGYLRSSAIDYTAVCSTANKKTVTVLQMCHLFSELTDAKFKAYLEPVQEYDFTIQLLYNDDWYKLFHSSSSQEANIEKWKDFLSNYDMVIFGFGDSNSYTSDAVFQAGMEDFADQGKGIIISYDIPDNDSDLDTTFVRMANNGQITTYPYKLDPVIEVLCTHTQSYQLDLDCEEDGDVNVWFTLSEQDGRSNFYIYSKENITYTGFGSCLNYSDAEIKLFVNTLIAAYRQPELAPTVAIENPDGTDGEGSSLIYLDYDGYAYDSEDGTSGSTVKSSADSRVEMVDGKEMAAVYFTISDSGSSRFSDRKCYLSVNCSSAGPEGIVIQEITEDDDGREKRKKITAGTDGLYPVEPSENGTRYVLYFPYSQVRDAGSVEYTLTTCAAYTKKNRIVKTVDKSATVDVMLLPLFDLD